MPKAHVSLDLSLNEYDALMSVLNHYLTLHTSKLYSTSATTDAISTSPELRLAASLLGVPGWPRTS